MANDNNEPCLVQAGQGFSVLYKERYLYSRYNPQKAVLQTVENAQLLPGTLIIAASPLLWYGMEELLKKLPENCMVLALETDKALYELSCKELDSKPWKTDGRLALLSPELLHGDIAHAITALVHNGGSKESPLPPIHTFRRAILIEMSGAPQLAKPLYEKAVYAAENTIATFWKNRLTLTRFGRLYARNLFKNLSLLSKTESISALFGSVQKPIILFGAGESAEKTAAFIAKLSATEREKCYVIAVDAALPALCARRITPDCVVAVESQLAIEKAYIGTLKSVPVLLADIVSRPQIIRHAQRHHAQVYYFASAYTNAAYLSELSQKQLLPPIIPPLGSVGLTAVYLALKLRANSHVPIFVTGLDFSFSLGKTHAQGSPAHTARLCSCTRLSKAANYDAAFRADALCINGKAAPVFTDKTLSSYAKSFIDMFHGTEQLFDAGENGIFLGLPQVSEEALQAYILQLEQHQESNGKQNAAAPNDSISYLHSEVIALNRLKTLLIQGEAVRSPTKTVQEEIAELLIPRDYLYLHFPDGYACKSDDVSFLKRVRSEIDFFLKDMQRE